MNSNRPKTPTGNRPRSQFRVNPSLQNESVCSNQDSQAMINKRYSKLSSPHSNSYSKIESYKKGGLTKIENRYTSQNLNSSPQSSGGSPTRKPIERSHSKKSYRNLHGRSKDIVKYADKSRPITPSGIRKPPLPSHSTSNMKTDISITKINTPKRDVTNKGVVEKRDSEKNIKKTYNTQANIERANIAPKKANFNNNENSVDSPRSSNAVYYSFYNQNKVASSNSLPGQSSNKNLPRASSKDHSIGIM